MTGQLSLGFVEPGLLGVHLLARIQAGDEIPDQASALARRQQPGFFLDVCGCFRQG